MKDNDTLRNMLIAGAVFITLMMISQKIFPPLPPGAAPGTEAGSPQPGLEPAASGGSMSSPGASDGDERPECASLCVARRATMSHGSVSSGRA